MNKVRLFLFACLFTLQLSAQVKIQKNNWTTSTELSEVPDSLKDEDAIFLDYDHSIVNTIVYSQNEIFPASLDRIYMRIKFISNRGVNKYSRFNLKRTKNQAFQVLDARTIKPGNKVVNLKDADLKKLEYNYDTKGTDDFEEHIRFSIPGVEVGDEVELVYVLSEKDLKDGEDVFLFSYLPCLRSAFTYYADNRIRTEVKYLSNMPAPKVVQEISSISYKWEMKGLPAFGREEFAIPTLTMPYVLIIVRVAQVEYANKFVHDYDISPSTWDAIYKKTNQTLEHYESLAKDDSSALADFIYGRFGHPTDSSGRFRQFCNFHQYVSGNLKHVGWYESPENKPLLYYLQNKKIDRIHLFLLYKKFFQMMGMNYYLGFGRNKYKGVLDTTIVAQHHISETFIAVNDSAGNMHYLIIGSPDNKYYLDEIPPYLEGTTVVLVGESPETKKTEFMFRRIATSPPDVNYHNERMRVRISFTRKEDAYELRDYYSGSLSTETRHFFEDLLENKYRNEYLRDIFPDSKMDSAVVLENSSTYPFPVTVQYFFRSPSLLTEIADSFYVIPLKKLFHFAVIESSDLPRTLDYYTERKYHHRCDYQIDFEAPVEIANNDEFSLRKENMFGSIEAKIRKLNATSIMVHLNYTVNSFRLPGEKYKDLKELENSFEDFINSNVILKKI